MLNGKTILITGGTGSFGKRFVEVVLEKYQPKKLIIFSRDELKQFEMSQKWNEKSHPCIRYFLGDVRDRDRLLRACKGVDYVIHAAALKQVPAAEYNPSEAIKTNVVGAMNIIDAALANGVERVIALSTDKACNPINLYGATKLCSDKLFTAASAYVGSQDTVFAVVRYGNVIGSRGSVIPFFLERRKTGVLPITDPRMTRFWISLEQGVQFVLKAFAETMGSEIFVPKLPSMNMLDLAQAIAPECKYEVVGIRPGEKIHEVMIGADDARNSLEFLNHYVILPQSVAVTRSHLYETAKPCPQDFEYNSGTNPWVLSVSELQELLSSTCEDLENSTMEWSTKGVPK
ncbi:UDP-N-acetylglucosamine 4,6-dehydratase (inverting) [Candidatus Uhrbacteria bacterium]|nr:UDP-N-acetylglucosamine 4,6-dehydratase (inverting) [Candidatus Uhrbacteria bacterium]